ncbi:MAG: hypothetical protein H7Z72_11180 [Bacteroidetes bacterium]|nr:hypothetical protein [Fibrella sp.]
MKKHLIPIFCFLLAAILTQFMAQRVVAQAAETTGMTAEQAKAVKSIKIGNIEKDTYFKADGFILDRYEERPAYVFNYTDGITRKICLYKVFDAATTKELGLAAFYVNGKTSETKAFVIPGANGDRKAWDAYIDDLKYVGEKEPGLMSTLTFVLSREMATLLSGGTSKADEGGAKKKEDYNFCFAADAPVTMADGSVKAISAVAPGDLVKSYDATAKSLVTSSVTRVDVHWSTRTAGAFALTGVWVVPVQEITAGTAVLTAPVLLEATANHPVLTAQGRKPLGEVKAGETLYHYEMGTNAVAAYRVVQVGKATRTVDAVYGLATSAGSYLVAETVVLDK